MHLACLLSLSTLVLSVSATAHRVCCCAGKDDNGNFHCSGPGADQAIDQSGPLGRKKLIRSQNRYWPTNFGYDGWMYASSLLDDGWMDRRR